MKSQLMKIVNNEYLDSSTLFNLNKLGLILKITYSQYVITKKGLNFMTNYGNPQVKNKNNNLILKHERS